jgi:hypothetical protein
MKNLIFFVFTWALCLGHAMADSIDRDGFVRSDNGNVRLLNQYAALRACPTGTHLPSLRELANECKMRGAQIFEKSQIDFDNIPSGYQQFRAVGVDGVEDFFYLDSSGYQNPGGELGAHGFWSASYELYGDEVGYVVDGATCEVDFVYLGTQLAAVRCLP